MAATLTSSGVNFSDGSTINGTAVNTIGSYSWLGRIDNSGILSIGNTLAGSSLRPAGVTLSGYGGWGAFGGTGSLGASGQNVTMAGTWRCMGYVYATSTCTNYSSASLWVRIS